MSSHIPKIPSEIWREILSGVPRGALHSISLAEHALRNLARPLLFAHFEFHPYAVLRGGSLGLPASAELDQAMTRLVFWCSATVAPLVRSCDITPWEGRVLSQTDDPRRLLDVFFEKLSSFTGLQRLSANQINFTLPALSNLRALTKLTHLDLNRCEIAAESSASLLSSLTSFSFCDDALQLSPRAKTWTSLLDPTRLRELHLWCDITFWADDLAAAPIFLYLRVFSGSFRSAQMNDPLAILAKFPGVEHLVIHHSEELPLPPRTDANTPPPLPALSYLACSANALPLLVPGTSLTHLMVSRCHAAPIAANLRGLRLPPTVTSLTLKVWSLDETVLNSILSSFPSIVDLRIDVLIENGMEDEEDDDDEDEEEINMMALNFFDSLPGIHNLPDTLQNLAISWAFEIDGAKRFELPDEFSMNDMRDAVLGRFMGLKALWLDGDTFLMRWRKLTDGTVIETSAENYDDAQNIRRGSWEFQ